MATYQMLDWAFFEGRIVPFNDAKVSIATHALQYGTGAFAGVRGNLDQDGSTINVFRLHDHAARLLRSAKLLRAELPYNADQIAQIIIELIQRNAPTTDIYIRPFIYKSALALSPRLRGVGDELGIYMLPLSDYVDASNGLKAIVSSWARVPDNVIPSRGKLTGAYINSAMAKDEAEEKGADEAILLNDAGKVSEGSGCNIFIVRDGALVTPPISSDILEGITRRSIIQIAQEENIPVEQRTIDRSELYIADEAFFCGTAMHVSPITYIDGRPVGDGKIGPIVSRIRQRFFDIIRGRDERHRDWLTPVRIQVAAPAD